MIFIFIITGLLLRINAYLANRSLWLDEAIVSLNIINKNIPDFLKNLDYDEFAPFGFLTSEKITINIFGNLEYSLRLLPLIVGLASVFLFYQFCKKFLSPKLLLFAVGLFSFSRPLIHYSSEAKQYSFDVAISLILFLIAFKKNPSLKSTLLFTIFGSLAVWFSHPAIFIVASIIIFKLFSSPKKSDLLIVFSWALSFLIYYLLSLGNLQTQNVELHWQNSFAAQNPGWYLTTFFTIFENPLDLFFPFLGAIVFLVGCTSLLLKNKKLFCLFTAPIFFALSASYLHRYPFADRFLLFLAPVFFLIMAKGVEALSKFKPAAFSIAVALLILLPQIFISVQTLFSPRLIEETRPLVTYWQANRQKDDIIYIYYSSIPSFRYYARGDNTNAVYGVTSRDNPELYEKDLEKLKDKPRVWILFSHVYDSEEEYMTSYLDKIGKELEDIKAPGASLYLYALNP